MAGNISDDDNHTERNFYWFKGAHCRAKYSGDNLTYEAEVRYVNVRKNICRVRYVGYENEEYVALTSLKASKGEAARNKQKRKSIEDFYEDAKRTQRATSEAYATIVEGPSPRHRKKRDVHTKKPVENAKKTQMPTSEAFATTVEGQSSRNREETPVDAKAFFPTASIADFGFPDVVAPVSGMIPRFIPPPLGVTNGNRNVHDDDDSVSELSALLLSWHMCGYYTGLYQGQKDAERKVSEK